MKKILFFGFFAGLVLMVSSSYLYGAANDTPAPTAHISSEDQAKAALESLQHAYTERNLEGFFKLVSDKSFFNSTDLKFQLDKTFHNFSQIELHFSIDRSLTENNKIALKTHWQKRMVRNSNGHVETHEGNAELVFKMHTEHPPTLINITGDSPF